MILMVINEKERKEETNEMRWRTDKKKINKKK